MNKVDKNRPVSSIMHEDKRVAMNHGTDPPSQIPFFTFSLSVGWYGNIKPME